MRLWAGPSVGAAFCSAVHEGAAAEASAPRQQRGLTLGSGVGLVLGTSMGKNWASAGASTGHQYRLAVGTSTGWHSAPVQADTSHGTEEHQAPVWTRVWEWQRPPVQPGIGHQYRVALGASVDTSIGWH